MYCVLFLHYTVFTVHITLYSGGPFLKCWCDLVTAIALHDDSGSGGRAVIMRAGLKGVELKVFVMLLEYN